jgi:hypothetical protein
VTSVKQPPACPVAPLVNPNHLHGVIVLRRCSAGHHNGHDTTAATESFVERSYCNPERSSEKPPTRLHSDLAVRLYHLLQLWYQANFSRSSQSPSKMSKYADLSRSCLLSPENWAVGILHVSMNQHFRVDPCFPIFEHLQLQYWQSQLKFTDLESITLGITLRNSELCKKCLDALIIRFAFARHKLQFY